MNKSPLEQLQQDANGYMKSCVLSTLAELDLGTVLLQNNNRLNASAIAQKISCDERACEGVLDAIAALGYFNKDSGYYSVADNYKELLDSRHPSSYIAILRHYASIQRSWMRLSWSVKSGQPQEKIPSILGAEQDKVSFIMGMNSIAVQLRDNILLSLEEANVFPEKENMHILDVGGASGTYTEAFLRKIPNSYATIFDLPVAINQSQARFHGTDLESRVQLVEGDYYKNDLPKGFDFVWLSAVLHQMNREKSRILYKKIWDAMNANGVLAIRDYIMNEDRTSPVHGSLFAINMLVNSVSGMVYTYQEIKEDLESVGFRDICHAVDKPSMSAIVTAKKY